MTEAAATLYIAGVDRCPSCDGSSAADTVNPATYVIQVRHTPACPHNPTNRKEVA